MSTGRPAAAQPDSSTAVLARAQSGRALASDPRGRLYVVEAGRDVVRVLDQTGAEQATLGGSGARAGEFDDPADVDPTNGQTLLVADAGNGRIQRFSAEQQYLEAVPVGRAFRDGGERRVFEDGRDGTAVRGQGRPTAVASTPGNATFLIDARDEVVVKWNEQRRFEQIVGGAWAQAPRTPVALAVEGTRRLYVADRAREAVLAYDLFGTFEKRLDTPPLPDLRALAVHRGRLWIVCAGRLLVWEAATGQTTERAVDVSEPLVDVARHGDALFVLTESRLLRRPVRNGSE